MNEKHSWNLFETLTVERQQIMGTTRRYATVAGERTFLRSHTFEKSVHKSARSRRANILRLQHTHRVWNEDKHVFLIFHSRSSPKTETSILPRKYYLPVCVINKTWLNNCAGELRCHLICGFSVIWCGVWMEIFIGFKERPWRMFPRGGASNFTWLMVLTCL